MTPHPQDPSSTHETAEKTPEDHVRDGLNFVGDKALFGAFVVFTGPAALVFKACGHYAPGFFFGGLTLALTGTVTAMAASPLLAAAAACKLGAHALKPTPR